MKTISELRGTLRLRPEEVNSSVKYFSEQNIDWEVFLPTKGIYLQRPLVWTLEQKREIIWSMLMRRHIPRMAIINTIDDTYQIIDGKQRLSSMISFINDGFTLLVDGNECLFSELPKDYQTVLSGYMFAYYIVHEESRTVPITDQDKIDWFRFINFAGTPQDAEHMQILLCK